MTFERPDDEAKRLVSEAAEYCKACGREVDVHYARGRPENLIPQHVQEWEADLVVLGTSTEKLFYDDDWVSSESKVEIDIAADQHESRRYQE